MKRTLPSLKNNGQHISARVNLLASRLNRAHLQRAATTAEFSAKEEIMILKKLKREQHAWEKIWKMLLRQKQNKENEKHKAEIGKAINEAETNFRIVDEAITDQKGYLKRKLGKQF